MSNELSEHEKQKLETLEAIRDRLPVPAQPLEIKADDQAGLNSHVDEIASGAVTIVPAEIVKPSYAAHIKQIPETDQAALNAHLEALAKGDAVVVIS